MKSFDLNTIKDREVIIMSTEEAFKDIEPFFREEDIKKFWECKKMNDLDLDQIKQLYCKYRCNLKDQTIFAVLEGGNECPDCHRDVEAYIEDDNVKIGDSACKICQWDNIISELKEFNLIKK